jgi:dipeptidase E
MSRPPLRLVHSGPGEERETDPVEHVPGHVAWIYLGNAGTADQEGALWRRMLRDGMRVVYWPFAVEPSDYDDGLRWVRREAARVARVTVELWRDLGERDESDLEGVDLVWVGGGNTYALLDHVRRTDWVERIRAHVLAGGPYYGGSAGAVLAGADIDIARFADPNDVGLADTTGLGLLGRALVRPHWTDSDATRAGARLWTWRSGAPVLGIPDDGGLVVRDGVATSTGPGTVYVSTPENFLRLEADEVFVVHRSRL